MELRRRRPPRLRAAVAVGLTVTAGAGASRGPRPSVADISFRLGRAVVWSDEGRVLEVATEPVSTLPAFPSRP